MTSLQRRNVEVRLVNRSGTAWVQAVEVVAADASGSALGRRRVEQALAVTLASFRGPE